MINEQDIKDCMKITNKVNRQWETNIKMIKNQKIVTKYEDKQF